MESMPSQLHESCAEMPHFSVEDRAVKIGDTPYSHISLIRDSREFSKDFSLWFEFRSYYPNGLIFLVRGQNNKIKFQLSIGLRGGYIVADLSDKRKTELISTNRDALNDGQWHNVSLSKVGKTLSLAVDNYQMVESTKVRRKLALKGPIYIGGVPERLNEISDNYFNLMRESFKGCLKNFHINEEYVDLVSGLMYNISECFTRIEKGAYFPGDGFAIFDERFNLGFKMDIELEFKTTRLNAILLSLSNGTDYQEPSLSIELFNGDVIASVDIGDGPIRAVKKFISKYDMCDGKWHLIKVQYTKSSISLKVDKHEVVYGLNEKENHKKSEPYTLSPLYIGGLPDLSISPVLQQNNHFVGCLRNVAINDKRKDWISDIQLFSVLPNSCPTN